MNAVYLTKAPVHTLMAFARKSTKGVKSSSLNSPTFRHRAIMGLFPSFEDAKPRSHAGILFRLETPAGEAPYFLIQSLKRPVAELAEGFVTKEVEYPELEPGTPVVFRIAVNAIRRESFTNASNKRSYKIRPVQPDHEESTKETMTPWLQNKLGDFFSELEITNHRRQILQDEGQKKFSLQLDLVDGIAVVSDPKKLNEALVNGIGREKAYGCGLLTVRPIQ